RHLPVRGGLDNGPTPISSAVSGISRTFDDQRRQTHTEVPISTGFSVVSARSGNVATESAGEPVSGADSSTLFGALYAIVLAVHRHGNRGMKCRTHGSWAESATSDKGGYDSHRAIVAAVPVAQGELSVRRQGSQRGEDVEQADKPGKGTETGHANAPFRYGFGAEADPLAFSSFSSLR